MITKKAEIKVTNLLKQIDIESGKYYSWSAREGLPNYQNGNIPKLNWILPWEKEEMITYAISHPGEGYRQLTYMMLDENVVAVSPSTTYRVLKNAGLLNRWNQTKTNSKGTGFIQPPGPNEHWHVDIKYVNFKGTFLFLISVIDGYSRYIVHHKLRMSMQEYDVQLTNQRTIEKYPAYKPRIISDSGSQFISKDFSLFIKSAGLQHIRTSIAYPPANGKIECYHRTAGDECLSKESFINLEDARKQIAEFVEFYNTKRLHSSLYYLTHEDFMLRRIK